MATEKMYENCNGNRIEISIPNGYHYVQGSVEDGIVIQNIKGDSFVRIPTGYTSDGLYVEGFWVSSYLISKGNNGQACSVSGEYPWTNISFYEAKEVAKKFGGDLLSKEEYNRICMWLVQTHAATFEQVFIDGKGMGDYSYPHKIQKNGQDQERIVNNIDSFWGNAYIWTTQRSELYEHCRIIRGGIFKIYKTEICRPPIFKAWAFPEKGSPVISFRIVLHDK